jgi:hypothetical protein
MSNRDPYSDSSRTSVNRCNSDKSHMSRVTLLLMPGCFLQNRADFVVSCLEINPHRAGKPLLSERLVNRPYARGCLVVFCRRHLPGVTPTS